MADGGERVLVFYFGRLSGVRSFWVHTVENQKGPLSNNESTGC